ncbi:MAG: transglutaminase family protein [Hyphomicrobiaceae bacterium]
MILDVSHKTLYRYSAHVVQSQHVVHMSPRVLPRQSVRHHSLIVEPAPAMRYDGTDSFGNAMIILDVEMPHKELVLHARSTIDVTPLRPFDWRTTTPWDRLDYTLVAGDGGLDVDTIQYRCASHFTPPSQEISDYAAPSFAPGRPVLDAAMNLTTRIYEDFTFDGTATDISTPIIQVVKQKRGVCQDFAHLALACLRTRRIPARYVSGYILTKPAPGQLKLQGTDASHAWISVWSPQAGWVDFDPTNGIAVSDEHVTIALGRDYNDVSPISGILLGGGAHTVTVAVDVVPVN